MIDHYIDKCPGTKLDRKQVKFLSTFLQKHLNHHKLDPFSTDFLLFYLEKCFDFSTELIGKLKAPVLVYYTAISGNSSWIVAELQSSDSSPLLDSFFQILNKTDIVVCFTQRELQNMVDFLSTFYRPMQAVLIFSLVLSKKLSNYTRYENETFVYFCRSLFDIFEKQFQKQRQVRFTLNLTYDFVLQPQQESGPVLHNDHRDEAGRIDRGGSAVVLAEVDRTRLRVE